MSVDANTGVLIAALATTVCGCASTIATILVKDRSARKTRLLERRFEQEDRALLANQMSAHSAEVLRRLAENTAMTAQGTEQAKEAYTVANVAFTEANEVNAKLAALGARLVDSRGHTILLKTTHVAVVDPPADS